MNDWRNDYRDDTLHRTAAHIHCQLHTEGDSSYVACCLCRRVIFGSTRPYLLTVQAKAILTILVNHRCFQDPHLPPLVD